MLQDARFALRLFARRPGVALLVLTLAIGIAATTTVFSLADAILWHPVPFRDPARLVHLRAFTPLQSGFQMTVPVAALDAWPARAEVFASLHPRTMVPAVVGRGGEEEVLTVAKLSTDLLSDLGVRVQRGRGFEAADAVSGRPGSDRSIHSHRRGGAHNHRRHAERLCVPGQPHQRLDAIRSTEGWPRPRDCTAPSGLDVQPGRDVRRINHAGL